MGLGILTEDGYTKLLVSVDGKETLGRVRPVSLCMRLGFWSSQHELLNATAKR